MKILELTLTAEEPLVITNGSAESMAHSCLEYIPGSMLLGAFAAAWIQKNPGNPDASPSFQRLFLNGDTGFGSAYPVCVGSECVPVPLSFMREKSMGGLPVDGLPFDPGRFLIFNPLALADSAGENELQRLWEGVSGSNGQPAKFKKLAASFMNAQTLRQPDLRMVWNTRVALGHQRHALESQLFGFSALAAGSQFRTAIHCRSAEAAQELGELVESLISIRVGHARSAGYGLCRMRSEWRELEPGQTESRADHDIFLLSSYLADAPWEKPLPNLLEKLADLTGQKPVIEKSFIAYAQIEGFNGHWKRPRDSRPAIAQGSALKARFARACQLPQRLELGADNHEGYGRILVDPPFLAEVMPRIPAEANREGQEVQALAINRDAPFWAILRRRALARAAQKQALMWLEQAEWQQFLADAARLRQPSLSQISNLLRMDPEAFKAMTAKTSGMQWSEAVASNPFGSGREHLDAIMLTLLAPGEFGRAFRPASEPVLPGGAASEAEKREFMSQSHALFLRELIRTWIKNSRSSQKEEE